MQSEILREDFSQIESRDLLGNTLMHLCCESGHLTCAKTLHTHAPQLTQELNKAKLTPTVLAIKVIQFSFGTLIRAVTMLGGHDEFLIAEWSCQRARVAFGRNRSERRAAGHRRQKIAASFRCQVWTGTWVT